MTPNQNTPSPVDVRDAFFHGLHEVAKRNRNVVLLTDDQGAFGLEKFREDLPDQYMNIGIAEQNLVAMGAGMALSGKIPFLYGISTFMSMRCFEQIKVDASCMKLPVVIVGSGPGFAYGSDGPTHHATQDVALLRALPDTAIYNPTDATLTATTPVLACSFQGPTYIRLEKGIVPDIYSPDTDFSKGLHILRNGDDLCIVSTGIMVHRALEIADSLASKGIRAGVVDVFRLKPIDSDHLIQSFGKASKILTLEETSIVGGLGSIVAEIIVDESLPLKLRRIGSPDRHVYEYGSRDWIHEKLQLDVKSVSQIAQKWIQIR